MKGLFFFKVYSTSNKPLIKGKLSSIPLKKDKTVFDTDNLAKVAKSLKLNKRDLIYVLNQSHEPIGFITKYELFSKVLTNNFSPKETMAKEIMHSPIFILEENLSILKAVEELNFRKLSICPVTKNGVFKGILDSTVL